MALTTITVRVAAATQSFATDMAGAFAGAQVQVENFEKDFEASSQRMNATAVFLGNTFSDLARTIGRAFEGMLSSLKGFAGDAIATSAKYNTALLALINATRSFGQSSTDAIAAAQGLTSKGLLPIGDAARGLRNLLVTGFGLKESVDIMNVFQDTAVNARKATYEFNDAVVAGTEGLRTGQARLVTATGVTKNFGAELKAAGLTMADLTNKSTAAAAQHAIYTGILREGAVAAGDAARALGTYSGATIALHASYKSLAATVGDFLTRNQSVVIVVRTLGDWMRNLSANLQNNKQAYDLVSEAIILVVKGMSELLQIADYVQTAYFALRTVFDNFAIGVVKSMVLILEASQKLSNIGAMFDPSMAEAYKRDAKAAGDAITYLNGTVDGFKADIKDATATSAKWGNQIQEVKSYVDKLSTELEKSKGHMLALDAAARQAGDGFDRFADDINKKALKAIKDIAEAIQKLDDKLKIYHGEPLGVPVKLVLPQEEQLELLLEKLSKELADKTKLGFTAQVGFKLGKLEIPKDIWTPLEAGFELFAKEVPNRMYAAIKAGDSLWQAVGTSLAQSMGDAFSKEFQIILEQAKKQGRKTLTDAEKEIGYMAEAAQAALQGVTAGYQSQSKKTGVITGAVGGAEAGLALAPFTMGASVAIGAGIGGLAGLIGGIFGAQSKADKALADLRTAKQALLDQVGGYAKLKAEADAVGVSVDAIYNATNITAFNAAVDKLNKALADQQANVTAIGTAMDAINTRAQQFAAPFQALVDAQTKAQQGGDTAGATAAAQQLMATAQAGQAEFERLGTYVQDAFAGFVKNGGSAMDALTKMAPAFQVLQDGVSKFGLTSNAVIDELLADFNLVNDQGMKPLFDQIQATGTILQSLISAKALSPEGFQAAAADIGASLQGIIDKGGDVSRTLALNQPILQSLWEAQQQYGAITDDTTASLLKQAEQQGLVGENMKSVNEQILDVLLAIGKVLGADLPQDFKKLNAAAQDTANGIEDSFNNIQVEPIKIEYQTSTTGDTPPVALARGGIVRRPTLALVGEGGPEAVVPLNGRDLGLTGAGGTAIVEVDGRTLAEVVVPAMPGVIKRYGLK